MGNMALEQIEFLVGTQAVEAQKQCQAERDAQLALRIAQGAKLLCPKCGREEHEGVTCEKFREWEKENDQAEVRFVELMAKQQWRKCPVCKAPSERASGCNFMQCRSNVCRGHNYWCYVCGHQLSKDQHYSHYPRSPYYNECNTPPAQRLVPPPPPLPAGAEMQAGVPQRASRREQAQKPTSHVDRADAGVRRNG